jgi:predicted Zn-dependent peptidase
LKQIGATDLNGTTWFDRTNYFQTVPTPALERALFLESDRMGHLLGAVTQEKLDNQRGVVQNEKRQGDNEPYGLVEYAQLAALFPEGHPYRHSTIGSMADLDAASLETVKDWFRTKYGPNNAVLVLAGDIDAKTAKPLVEKWFGDIPRGPEVVPAAADVPTLPARKEETMRDRVATTRLYRLWAAHRSRSGEARHRGLRARRAFELAARQCAGPQGEGRGQRLRERPALRAGEPVRGDGRRETGGRPGNRQQAARCDHRRADRARPDSR